MRGKWEKGMGMKKRTVSGLESMDWQKYNFWILSRVALEALASFMTCRCADTLSLGLIQKHINALGPAFGRFASSCATGAAMRVACRLRFLCCPLEGNPSGLGNHTSTSNHIIFVTPITIDFQFRLYSRAMATLVWEDSYENDAQASVGDKRKRQETLENYMLLDMKVSESQP